MRTVTAIDPGTHETAIVRWDGSRILKKAILPNEGAIEQLALLSFDSPTDALCIEMISSYGMPVGKEVFETCVFIGRIYQLWFRETGQAARLIYRKDIKMHLCQSVRAKDGNVRQALIDRYGAPGTKKAQGVTYGISKHLWAALAVAVFAYDTIGAK